MAGVYVPSMQIPDGCKECPFHVGIDITLRCGLPKDIHTACPLVFVPDHGRLVDVDEVCNRLLTLWDTADKEKKVLISAVLANIVTPIVVGTPTIIPADKEKVIEK